MNGPLSGIRVIELAVWHNGAAAGYMLGDLGAEVIKIEQPGVGDPTRGLTQAFGFDLRLPGGRAAWFEMNNRSKKSISLDLKKESGKEVLYRLVRSSDVFFTNYDAKTVAKLGADYQTLSSHNPHLIWAINTGVGLRGPEAGKRTFDSSIQARTGFMYRMGNAEGDPMLAGGGMFDQMGATMLVYGIMAALFARERTGRGQAIETSMLSSALHLQQDNVHMYLWKDNNRFGASTATNRDPFINWYRCADGKWLMLNEPHPDQVWHKFCDALEVNQIVDDPRFTVLEERIKHARELASILERALSRKSREEWFRIFREKGVDFVYVPVNSVAELVADSQVLANDYIVETEHPTLGHTRTVGLPVHFSRTPGKVGSPPPECGQHTEEVLLELAGYSWEEISQLRSEGAI